MSASSHQPNRRVLERALDELRVWRRQAIKGYAQATDDEQRRRWRQQADDAEYLAFRLEQLLHPAGNAPAEQDGDDQ